MSGRFAPPERSWFARLWGWITRQPKPKKWVLPIDEEAKKLIENFDRLKEWDTQGQK